MGHHLLAYLFICFSIGLVCMGAAVAVVHPARSRVARGFLALYTALTIAVLAGLLISFVDVLSRPVSSETRAVLEYLDAMVGFYGVMFTLPFFAHRIFAVRSEGRDLALLAVVSAALVLQHWTEYGLRGRWDARGDLIENLLFLSIVAYTLALGIARMRAPGVEQPLASRFLVLLGLCIPAVVHDLFLMETTSLRLYPLWYSVSSLVIVWTLCRSAASPARPAVPGEWNLSGREAEVAALVLRGRSNKEIAAELCISSNTVKTHLRSVFDKSGCQSRFELMSALVGGPRDHDSLAIDPAP